jgi:hypothetical protein
VAEDDPKPKFPWETTDPKKPVLVELPPGVDPPNNGNIPVSGLPISQSANRPTPDPVLFRATASPEHPESGGSKTVRDAVQKAMHTSDERDVIRDESLRGDLERAAQASAPDNKSHDYAGIGMFELLGLMFGLPPSEAFYHGNPIDFRMLCFIAAGVFFGGLGTAWPTVRKKFPQQALVLSVSRIASDARYWLAIILVGFLYAASPEIYRRATTPIAVTGAIGSMPIGEVTPAEQIKQATKAIAAERDEAIKSAARAAKERDDALLALQRKEEALTTQPSPVKSPTAQKGPIVWNSPGGQQLFVVVADASGYMVSGALFWGESTEPVSITEAYAISGMTGHKQDLKANVPNKGYFPVDKVDIPPGAPVHLDIDWNPPIPLKDFLNQWGKFHVVVKYNGIKFERDYDEALVRQKLQQQAPDMFGPQMTPRDDK